jgi:hypothetical protein
MKRAYNYFFGGVEPKSAEPTSPVISTVNADAVKSSKMVSEDEGLDTPPQTPGRAVQSGENGTRTPERQVLPGK